jgi:hypothetical protein
MSFPVSVPPTDPQAAIELSRKLDAALEVFAGEHGVLLRKAAAVPDSVEKLDMVVICTFLGHTLDRLSLRAGREHAEDVVRAVLDELDRVRSQRKAHGAAH